MSLNIDEIYNDIIEQQRTIMYPILIDIHQLNNPQVEHEIVDSVHEETEKEKEKPVYRIHKKIEPIVNYNKKWSKLTQCQKYKLVGVFVDDLVQQNIITTHDLPSIKFLLINEISSGTLTNEDVCYDQENKRLTHIYKVCYNTQSNSYQLKDHSNVSPNDCIHL